MYNPFMASWIVHLQLAETLMELIPGFHPVSFAVGSIAPDSGIPDEKWEKFDPPTEVTHIGIPDRTDIYCADLEFFRKYLLPLRGETETAAFSFRLGYFFHLVTDNLWHQQIGRPTTEKYSAEFAADKDFIWEVKKDWYGLDFIYLRDHPGCLFWKVFLAAEPETGGLDFLPLEGVQRQLTYIQEYYQRTDETVQRLYNRPYLYLSAEDRNHFVQATSVTLNRIYQWIWVQAQPTDEAASALDMLV